MTDAEDADKFVKNTHLRNQCHLHQSAIQTEKLCKVSYIVQ